MKDSRQQQLFDVDAPPWEIDDQSDRLVASVVFAEMPYGPFDYTVPDRFRDAVAVGGRVRVPLGRGNRAMVGYCVDLQHDHGSRRLKDIRGVMDARPLASPSLLQLTRWMADYYLSPLGVVLEGVIPAGVRGKAGTREVTLLSVPTEVAAKLTQLDLPAKQAAALRLLASAAQPMTPIELARLAKCTLAPIKALRTKGLLREQQQRVQHAQLDQPCPPRENPWRLNPQQQAALEAILAPLNSGTQETILLHGVTGSGKTEVYIQAIEALLGFGRQAIVLVPEISLTPQTCQRFRSRFDAVAVLHSHLSDVERHWHWQRIERGEVQVVVGARSAVFAPVPQLGMIVVDEEHDASFKQDSAPRYHAREVALQRARMENVPLVLGSATPALESWHRAQQGEFRLIELSGRVLQRPLPDVSTIDLRTTTQDRHQRGAISRQLHQQMTLALRDGGQVILLLNRRGYATSIQCPGCGEPVRCTSCDISLTLHREANQAICHYCDYTIPAPDRCPACGSTGIRFSGFGTEKLEREVRSRFPRTTILRMDSDSMQKPGSHEQALARFRSGEVQILLGTQMIAKGLDFPNVTLVGVINADTSLHFPDFRAAERTFQLVTQVAGRTGRGERGGLVLVQTYSPEHPAIQAAIRHDYAAFARQELPVRREFHYPPSAAMLRIIIRGENEKETECFADAFAERLEQAIAANATTIRMLGPAPAPIAKLHGRYRFHILLQDRDRASLRTVLRASTAGWKAAPQVQWVADMDPVDVL
jgi:primosomal protein N' (replication factor Y)